MQSAVDWLRGAAVACLIVVLSPMSASAELTRANGSPFPTSKLIVGARWTSRRYNPPSNQTGDILPTLWADDGSTYVMIDDGATDTPVFGAYWRQSLARITGRPPHLTFSHVGSRYSPPPATVGEIELEPSLARGPLGPDYSIGLVEADHIFYATQESPWNFNVNADFTGLAGISYSTDHGQKWRSGGKPFPAPLGNLSWVDRGRGGAHPDGYLYGLASEREFNASTIVMGRVKPGVANITDPARWQWISSWRRAGGALYPVWSSSFKAAIPVVPWHNHITYPEMTYDAPLHRYLLTFTYAYALGPPTIWTNGAELIVLEAPQPWGPFSFVAAERDFGPSNGYDPGFPPQWIGHDGRDLWLKWAANFDGCAPGLDCSGRYGFNYRRLHLTLAAHH